MKIHFVGIGGIGMSALAQLHAMAGDEVTGSDRLINKGFRFEFSSDSGHTGAFTKIKANVRPGKSVWNVMRPLPFA